MKKFLLSFLAVASLVLGGMALVANAAPTSTIVQNLFITGLAGGGTECLHILNSGLVQATAGDCGSGAGTSTTLVYGVYPISVSQVGTNATVTFFRSGIFNFFDRSFLFFPRDFDHLLSKL